MNIKKQVFCNNCGKLGHLFHNCRVPITSIGIIPLRIVKKFNLDLQVIENVIDIKIESVIDELHKLRDEFKRDLNLKQE